jgi:uncharacterized membrane protein
MSNRYLKVTLADGSTAVSTFARLANVGAYVRKVLMGAEAFPIFTTLATSHPVTGEAVAMRSRSFLNRDTILSITEVDADGLDILIPAPAERGTIRISSSGVLTESLARVNAAIVAGVTLPKHYDAIRSIEYVIALVGTDALGARYVNVRTGDVYDGEWTMLARGDGRDLDSSLDGTVLEDGEDGFDGGDDDDE